MYFKYGTYQHSDNEVNLVSFRKRQSYDDRGLPVSIVSTMSLEGTLIASSQSSLKTAMSALETAYSLDGKDAALYHDDGTLSAHVLDSSQSITGVRVLDFAYPRSDGAEYATQRTYSITLEMELASEGGGHAGIADTISWEETLRIVGSGGPRFVYVPLLIGPPQKQITHQRTPLHSFQSGRAVGRFAYPHIPGPLFPNDELVEFREAARTSPRFNGSQYIDWPVTWSYQFMSSGPLQAKPNKR